MRILYNVHLHNLPMICPRSTVNFTLLDQIFIWVPVIIGVVSALYKIFSSVRPHCTTESCVTERLLFSVHAIGLC